MLRIRKKKIWVDYRCRLCIDKSHQTYSANEQSSKLTSSNRSANLNFTLNSPSRAISLKGSRISPRCSLVFMWVRKICRDGQILESEVQKTLWKNCNLLWLQEAFFLRYLFRRYLSFPKMEFCLANIPLRVSFVSSSQLNDGYLVFATCNFHGLLSLLIHKFMFLNV